MDGKVNINVGASVMSVDESGEPKFGESKRLVLDNTNNPEFEKIVHEANSFNEVYENLRNAGVYLAVDNSKVVMLSLSKGTVIFFNDGAVQNKIVLDKEISPNVARQLHDSKTFEEVNDVLVQNKVIDKPTLEAERETTFEGKTIDVDRADIVDDRDIIDSGAIGQDRYARYNDVERDTVEKYRNRNREIDGMDR